MSESRRTWKLTRAHVLDLRTPCWCGAEIGRECCGTKPGTVHFARRLRRVLRGLRAPNEHVADTNLASESTSLCATKIRT